MKKVKFGICQWAFFPLEGPYAARIVSELGLDGVELDLGEYERGFPLSIKRTQEAYREARDRYGIEYPSIAVNALLTNSMNNGKETEKGKLALLAIRKAVETADALNIPIIQLPSFIDGEIKSEQDLKNTIDGLAYACDLVRGKQITIATENLLSTRENRRVLEQVNSPKLKIFFDLQNYSLFRKFDTNEMLRELAPAICELHAKDGSNGRMSGALLGTGDAGFHASVKVLKEINYQGWIHLENYYDRYPLNNTGEDPYELLSKDLKMLRKSFGQ